MKINKKDNIKFMIAIGVLILLVCAAIYGIAKKGNKSVEADSEEIFEFEEQEGEEGEVGDFEGTLIVGLDEEEQENEDEKKEENKTNTNEQNKTDNNSSNHTTATGSRPYYIRVNKQANVVTIYGKDSNGNYTVPVKAMICSTGSYTPPCGKYGNSAYKTTGYKARWNYLQGAVYGQYATQITGNILFHSVPYTKKDAGSLEYWEYDKLGTAASLGCIRLTVRDAKWIYENISSGTTVEFYSDSNPGSLGKPSAQKISSNVECRDWDPTDPAQENPWKNVKQEEPKKEEKTNTINTNTEKANTVVDKTNSEKTNTIVDKTNSEKTNTAIDKTNTERTNTTSNKENTTGGKTNTVNTNTERTNTTNNKTNTERTNTTNTQKENTTNSNKTNTTKTNTATNTSNT